MPSSTPVRHASGTECLDPDIKSLVCARCWESVFSIKSFSAIWESSAEGVRFSNQSKFTKDLYESHLTYRTPPWAEILKSAESLCSYCILLRNTIRDSRVKLALPAEPQTSDVSVVTVLFNMESANQRIMITLWTERGSLTTGTSVYAEPENPASQYITARNVAWKVNDDESYKLALKCIDDCSRHECCPRPAATTLPTRVLDCADPSRLRLVTSDPSTKGSFVALSYVWGEPQLHCTTTANINAYRNSIDLAKAPKTITDAAIVTRKLGLRYLWVDSFCIIQDSDADKVNELGKMRAIYRNASITIVAARAHAVREGFLQNAYPETHFAPINLPFHCPDGTMGTITAIRRAPELDEPIDSRAWCLQERVLSPRLLMFSTLGLQYECQNGHVNVNDSPLGLPSAVPRLPDHAFTAEPGRDAEWQLDMAWDTILQRYTVRSITQPADKLVAVGGLAEQLHRLWPHSQYAAGLWTHQFPAALMWRPKYHQARPKVYRAPSWSWASLDGELMPRGMTADVDAWRAASRLPKDSEIICDVKDVVVNIKYPENPYGEVSSARLTLHAGLVRATWDTRADPDPQALVLDGASGHGLRVVGPRDVSDRTGNVELDAVDDLPGPPVVEVTLAGMTKNGVALPYIIRLGQHDITGLMLVDAHEQGGSGGATYRRIGRFMMHAENWSASRREDIHIV